MGARIFRATYRLSGADGRFVIEAPPASRGIYAPMALVAENAVTPMAILRFRSISLLVGNGEFLETAPYGRIVEKSLFPGIYIF